MSKEHLTTYLNGHLAGAHVALEIVDHLISENPDLGPALAKLRIDIAEDRQQLKGLMSNAGIPESRVRKAGAWISEGLVEVKLDVDDDSRGPLRRLERLEALALGIEGKIALWRALEVASLSNKNLASLNYSQLALRGRQQRASVEDLRLQASGAALAA